MENLLVGTFNLRNHYWQRNWDGGEFPIVLSNFIKIHQIDFLGVQELVRNYSFKLIRELGSAYTINGGYRYGRIPFIEQFNESNAVITRRKVLEQDTSYLARIPFLSHGTQMPRIVTTVKTDYGYFMNTHVEYWKESAQIYQLQVLYRHILEHQDQPLIITGDFNVDIDKSYFVNFIDRLAKIGVHHIDNRIPTYQTKNQVLDHVFVSDDYDILDVDVVYDDDIQAISDHRPILVKLQRK